MNASDQAGQKPVNITGLWLQNLSRPEFFERFRDGVVYPLNVDVVMKSRHDPDLRQALQEAELLICDSQIILTASRFLGTPFKDRLSGSDLLGEFCIHHRDDPSVSLFLLGAAPGVAAEAGRRINIRTGRDIVIGTHSPSFRFEHNADEREQVLAMVRESGATYLVVALGVPKQEKFIAQNRAALPGIRGFMAVGATLDFEAGRVRRAPAWMSRNGLEWFFRLMSEPRRLSRRYLIENPPFLWLIFRQRFGLGKDAGDNHERTSRTPR